MISRPEAIQRLLDLFDAPHYLEIGVDHGDTFKRVRASRKVAVDPKFHFEFPKIVDVDAPEQFHEVTSDVYFGEIVKSDERFDVVFLDGLHITEQTLRDLLNAVMFIRHDGIIVIDDVIPASYHASLADVGDLYRVREFLAKTDSRLESDQAWMGDVYKLAFFVQTFMQQFSYATISDNHGQTIMWRDARKQQDLRHYSLEAVGRLEFKDLIKDADTMNLMPLSDITEKIRFSRGIPQAVAQIRNTG